jgi:hypothetical protein
LIDGVETAGLIDRVIETLGLDIRTASGKFTPAEAKPLVKDADCRLQLK